MGLCIDEFDMWLEYILKLELVMAVLNVVDTAAEGKAVDGTDDDVEETDGEAYCNRLWYKFDRKKWSVLHALNYVHNGYNCKFTLCF